MLEVDGGEKLPSEEGGGQQTLVEQGLRYSDTWVGGIKSLGGSDSSQMPFEGRKKCPERVLCHHLGLVVLVRLD